MRLRLGQRSGRGEEEGTRVGSIQHAARGRDDGGGGGAGGLVRVGSSFCSLFACVPAGSVCVCGCVRLGGLRSEPAAFWRQPNQRSEQRHAAVADCTDETEQQQRGWKQHDKTIKGREIDRIGTS